MCLNVVTAPAFTGVPSLRNSPGALPGEGFLPCLHQVGAAEPPTFPSLPFHLGKARKPPLAAAEWFQIHILPVVLGHLFNSCVTGISHAGFQQAQAMQTATHLFFAAMP